MVTPMVNYILDEHGEPLPCPNPITWVQWYATHSRSVGRTEVNGLTVFTSFLGINHNFTGIGPPLLFETMIETADGHWLDYQERYATRPEAIAGHTRAIDWVIAGYGSS